MTTCTPITPTPCLIRLGPASPCLSVPCGAWHYQPPARFGWRMTRPQRHPACRAHLALYLSGTSSCACWCRADWRRAWAYDAAQAEARKLYEDAQAVALGREARERWREVRRAERSEA